MASMLEDEQAGRDFESCFGLIRALRGDIERARAVLEDISNTVKEHDQ